MKPPFLRIGLGLAVSLLAASDARADGVLCALGPASSGYVPLTDQPASPTATRETKRLFSLVCPKDCGQIGVFRNPSAPNAMTMSVGAHLTKIVYNAAFLEGVVKAYGLGASLGILAHEIGHHVDTIVPPPPWMNVDWSPELRADAWAGCELARAGNKPAELKAALQAIAMSPSPSHPAWSVRADALQKGFSGCGGGALAALDVKKVGGPGRGGCTDDNDCKSGRVCYENRCQDKSARPNFCAKDVDCPGNELCSAAGVCQGPQGPAGAPAAGERVASAGPTPCRDRCGDDKDTCSGRNDASLRACKADLVSDPRYKECGCPRWPAGRMDCYQFCKETYDKAKACEASHEAAGTACRSMAARCVSDCR